MQCNEAYPYFDENIQEEESHILHRRMFRTKKGSFYYGKRERKAIFSHSVIIILLIHPVKENSPSF